MSHNDRARWLSPIGMSISITMRYAHLAPKSLDKLTAILDQQPEEKPRTLPVVKEQKG